MDKKELAKEFADQLRADLKDRIVSIRLFGSVAKEREGEKSDIDILVLSKESVFKDLNGPIGRVLEAGAVPEVVNLTLPEYERMKKIKAPFYRTIENEAIEL